MAKAAVLLGILLSLTLLLGGSGYALASNPSTSGSNQSGSCPYVGLITLVLANGTSITAKHYECSGAPVVSSTTRDGPQPLTASGNSNYVISWSSGSCNVACTDTQVAETNIMKPNTAYWSIQDNALVNQCGGTQMSYQDVMVVGTSSNSYTNQLGIEWFAFPYCLFTTTNTATYNILGGYNLNSGTTFETWYTLASGGNPTTVWVRVTNTAIGNNVFSYALPSGYPSYPITAWEENVVCSSLSCTTNFTQGSGSLIYYQNYVTASSPTAFTGENSNCAYSSLTLYYSYAYGTFTC
jgi:hypothetical protein